MGLPIHLYRSDTQQWVGQVTAEHPLYDRSYVEWEGAMWAILERRHHYFLKGGQYQLQRIALFVRPVAVNLVDRVEVNGQWFIGDPSCRFNAQSELLRCVPNPSGPCPSCRFYEPRNA